MEQLLALQILGERRGGKAVQNCPGFCTSCTESWSARRIAAKGFALPGLSGFTFQLALRQLVANQLCRQPCCSLG
ncbi:hypothetical protein KBY83_08240 [Cyanobium sp. WKJ7-Wakatipu]|uniref:hypothetical protein n=1 Tax=Cyanobium sp. WKJ7-Wakatipu TaxID=2823726 RepID=UPI0020CF49C0|nr:hypothetical protein [Cyanobium sp. WKJ7-Wakatipu]MCP9783307.1 hypothetical protein [Cyanobium sp. WKJ7-Wakatipu]